jgi:hypothetical protein
MKFILNWHGYETSQLIPQSQTPPKPQLDLRRQFNRWWHRMLESLTTSSDPHVWVTTHADGRTHWHAYLPTTGESVERLSEIELLVWLEERHHRYDRATN